MRHLHASFHIRAKASMNPFIFCFPSLAPDVIMSCKDLPPCTDSDASDVDPVMSDIGANGVMDDFFSLHETSPVAL